MTLTCMEEIEIIHQGCMTFPRLYVRAFARRRQPVWKRSGESTKDVRPFRGYMSEPLLDDVNQCGRGRENPPRM
ncbi:hypothetical protein MA16_Dca022781 [Dendrobium catenatum]|uniref:Uncharacterized protein n=1 Tax=Dendrobium catenatum TaxID=906689 RepID=A0A2I0WL14_9ASPA|nr:hypothetical protein MA16_Dca022781 [Dendrobium catenatum]